MKAKPRLTRELDRDSRLEVTRRGTPWCGSISAIVRSNFPENFFELKENFMPDKEPRVSKTRKRETKDEDAEKQSKEKQRKRTNIPLEVNLVRLRPRQNPLAPELRLKFIKGR